MTATAFNARTITESAIFQTVMAERDKYRAALVSLRGDHEPDRIMYCLHCERPWPCSEREFLDELLHPTGGVK